MCFQKRYISHLFFAIFTEIVDILYITALLYSVHNSGESAYDVYTVVYVTDIVGYK